MDTVPEHASDVQVHRTRCRPMSASRVLGLLSANLCSVIVAFWIGSYFTAPMELALDHRAATVVSVHHGNLWLGRYQPRSFAQSSYGQYYTPRFDYTEAFQINWRIPGAQFQLTKDFRYRLAGRASLLFPAAFSAICSVCLMRSRSNTFLDKVKSRRWLTCAPVCVVGTGFLVAGCHMLAWCYTAWTAPPAMQRNWMHLEAVFNRGCISCLVGLALVTPPTIYYWRASRLKRLRSASERVQKKPHPRLQFILRMLLLLTAVFAVWLGIQLRKAHKQRTAVAAIEMAGGIVNYESSFPANSFIARIIGPEFTEHVDFVRLNDRRMTDDDLAPLAHLPRIKTLDLTKCSITDDGLAHVQGLVELESLHIRGTSVSDRGLDVLEEMPSLKYIICVDCPVSTERVTAFRRARPDVQIISTWQEDWDPSVP